MIHETYTIDEVTITLTQPGDSQEIFVLERPNIFEFGFRKVEILPDYPDGDNIMRRGYRIYPFIATYQYESHDMDLRKLLTARSIELKFPPVFGDTSKYQTANVGLINDSVPDNWLSGLVIGKASGNAVPKGSATLRFEGENPYSEDEMMEFHWKQSGSDYIET